METMPYWRKTLLIPQTDGNKYVKISSDFIQEEDKKKADKLYEELLNGIEFVDSKAHIVNEDYICLGGACIPAKGLRPTQLFYGLMDLEETGGLVSAQISFSSEGYQQDVEKVFEGIEWDDLSQYDDKIKELTEQVHITKSK